MKTPAAKLEHSINATARSRFAANARLSEKDRALTRLTAFTSVYLIILTLLPYFMKLPVKVADTLNFITVIFSLIILVSTLLQYSSGDVVAAEQHHRAGLEMNEVLRDLRLLPQPVTFTDLEKITHRYNAVLQKYSINHAEVDFLKYQLQNRSEYPDLTEIQVAKIGAVLFYQRHFHLALLGIITGEMLFLVFGYAYPMRIETALPPECGLAGQTVDPAHKTPPPSPVR